jgi:hypothetical protein
MAQPRRIFSSDIIIQTLEQKTLEAISLEAKDQDAVVIQSRDQAATVIQSRDQQAIVIQSTNQEATELEARGQDAETNTLAARNDRALDNASTDYNNRTLTRRDQQRLVPAPAFAAGFEANTGKIRVQRLGDDPVAVGVPVTNGAIATGQRITLRGDRLVDAMPRVRPEPKPSIEVIESLPVKYLYSVTRKGKPEFYVGGWKYESTKVEIPEDDRVNVRSPRITNLGKQDWIVSYHLGTAGKAGYSIRSTDQAVVKFAVTDGSLYTLSGIGFGDWTALMDLYFISSFNAGATPDNSYSVTMTHLIGGEEIITQGSLTCVYRSNGSGGGLLAPGSTTAWRTLLSPDLVSKNNYWQATTFGVSQEKTQQSKMFMLYPVAIGQDGTYGIAALQEGGLVTESTTSSRYFSNSRLGISGQPGIHGTPLYVGNSFPVPKLCWFSGNTISEPYSEVSSGGSLPNDLILKMADGGVSSRFDVIAPDRFTLIQNSSYSSTGNFATNRKIKVTFYDSTFTKIKDEEFKCYPPNQFNDGSTTALTFYNFSHEPIAGS